jgi:hypothetical protein
MLNPFKDPIDTYANYFVDKAMPAYAACMLDAVINRAIADATEEPKYAAENEAVASEYRKVQALTQKVRDGLLYIERNEKEIRAKARKDAQEETQT